MEIVELELCANCKKEIPHTNYVMHTVHCARNITLCPICKEPISKMALENHKREFHVGNFGDTIRSSQSAKRTNQISSTNGYSHTNASTTESVAAVLEKVSLNKPQLQSVDQPLRKIEKPKSDLIPCNFCDLELSKAEITNHETYCGTRTDKCMACGEIVMFKYKKLHEESNHGFVKLNDEPGPRPTWDSSSERSSNSRVASNGHSPFSDGNYRPMPLRTTSLLDTTLYSFPGEYRSPVRQTKQNAETYKQITRRLDCKTEYIKNLLHDSASITVPIRTNAMTPRNRFDHNKGPAPLPPTSVSSYTPASTPLSTPNATLNYTATPTPHTPYILPGDLPPPSEAPAFGRHQQQQQQQQRRRPTPSTELLVPCDYCTLVLPHRDLVEHEAVCGQNYLSTERTQANARRRKQTEEWGGVAAGGGAPYAVYGIDGEDDGFYSAYRTNAPVNVETAADRKDNSKEGDANGRGIGKNSPTSKTNNDKAAPASRFDFNRPVPSQSIEPITVSSLLSPSSDYSPSRPSLVSILGGSTTSPPQSCAGAAAASAALASGGGGVSPEVQLPCEFCADLIPASQLLRHQATCF